MERFERNILCEGFSQQSQHQLHSAKVLVVGAGGLGGVVLTNLAMAGVGTIGIFEFDNVSITNLQRQLLFSEKDLNSSKATVAQSRLMAINSQLNCVVYNQRFTVESALEIASQYDIIVDCTDNFEARYAIDEVSQKLDIPFVYGSVQNMTGQVSTFNYASAASYSELFPPPQTSLPIVGVLTPMPSIVGAVEALEVIKVLTGSDDTLAGRLWLFDGVTYQTTIFSV